MPRKRTAGPTTEEADVPVEPQAKKTRFVEPEEDPALFAEDVEAQLENPSAKRKGRVKEEGYESDSTDDGEGVVFSRRRGNEGEEEEDDDMFAVGNDDEEKEDGKKKQEKFLRLGDIEGQEFGDPGSDGDSEDENEPEDEDDALRRKKAGMGYELSSFNMREEMEEGKFAEDGTYVKTFDPHGVHDRWMEGLDDKDIKLARRRKRQRDREQREKMKAEEQELEAIGGKAALQRTLLAMLKKGETVLEALQRLGGKAKKSQKSAKSRNQLDSNGDSVDVGTRVNPPSAIDHITHLASSIMSLGDTDVYSSTYEELVRAVRSSGNVDSSWEPPSADVKYEYKWDVPGATDGQVFGPFGENEMKAWFKASYFGSDGEKVKVRETGEEWENWGDVFS